MSEACRVVANLAKRKNLHTPLYVLILYVLIEVCLSVCLSVRNNIDLNYLWTGEIELAYIFLSASFHPF